MHRIEPLWQECRLCRSAHRKRTSPQIDGKPRTQGDFSGWRYGNALPARHQGYAERDASGRGPAADQYAVDEARAAGIEQFIFVTGRGKSAIEDHFDHSVELEGLLKARSKSEALADLHETLMLPGNIAYVRQQEPLGLGHAVWCARHLVGDEPFAVLLADDLIQADTPCLKQMADVFAETEGNVIAAMEVPDVHTCRYGIIDAGGASGAVRPVHGLVEKPEAGTAPSISR